MPAIDPASRRVALALVLGILVAFAPTLTYGFVDWDDDQHVHANPLLVEERPLAEHLLTPALGYPIPITILTYRIEVALGALELPGIFHATNVALHITAVLLLLALARRLGLSPVGAAIAATLFALHPVVAEPVTWVSGRKDLLAAVLTLAALLVWRARPRRAVAITSVLAVLAILAKPTALALVPMLALLAPPREDGTPRPLGERVRELAPLALFACALVPVVVLSNREAGGLRVEGDVLDKAHRALHALGLALRLLVGLEEPTVKYAVEPLPRALVPAVDLVPVVALPLLALLGAKVPPSHRTPVRAGLAIAALAYLPVSNLVPIYRFLADSYLYLPVAGLGLVLGALVELGTAQTRRPALFGGALVVVLALTCLPFAAASAERFSSTEALFTHGHERYPESFMLCRNWSVSLGDPERVLLATDECIARFGPDQLEKNRAIALFLLGRHDEAADWARRALARHPEDRAFPPELLEMAERTPR